MSLTCLRDVQSTRPSKMEAKSDASWRGGEGASSEARMRPGAIDLAIHKWSWMTATLALLTAHVQTHNYYFTRSRKIVVLMSNNESTTLEW